MMRIPLRELIGHDEVDLAVIYGEVVVEELQWVFEGAEMEEQHS